MVPAHDRPQGQKVWPEIVPDLKAKFLEEYVANGGVITHAAKAIGVAPATPRNWMRQDPSFLAQFEVARQEANDTIRTEIVRRAVEGWDEEVYQNGHFVGTVHKYDSNLLMFYAKSRMPEFRERVDITSDGQHLNAHETIVEAANDPEASELVNRLIERLASVGDGSDGAGENSI